LVPEVGYGKISTLQPVKIDMALSILSITPNKVDNYATQFIIVGSGFNPDSVFKIGQSRCYIRKYNSILIVCSVLSLPGSNESI
jgi:hypothetical protein